MRGGSLRRYHTPVVTPREGKGLAEELIKIAGPLIVQQAQAGLQDMQRGHSLVDTWSNRGEQVKRSLKRKDPALVWTVGKNQAKRTAKNAYKRVSESWRALEDFSKRKIAFDVTRPKDSSFRLIKLVGPSLASSRWRAIPCCTRPRD